MLPTHKLRFLCVGLLIVLNGCALSPDKLMQQWADDYHFSVVPQPQTAIRYALAIAPDSTPQQPLVVYIEGDGAAWPSRYHPPPDPTPQTPIAWQLAARDNAAKRAYLARPCQYLTAAQRRRCSRQYWTRKRFAVEVIQQYHHLLDQLKQQTASSRLILTGYSGGGVIATLLAAQRQDVDQLVTVAAPYPLTYGHSYMLPVRCPARIP